MGSYGKLATRALETEMPVMIKVYNSTRQSPDWVFLVFVFLSSEFIFLYHHSVCVNRLW